MIIYRLIVKPLASIKNHSTIKYTNWKSKNFDNLLRLNHAQNNCILTLLSVQRRMNLITIHRESSNCFRVVFRFAECSLFCFASSDLFSYTFVKLRHALEWTCGFCALSSILLSSCSWQACLFASTYATCFLLMCRKNWKKQLKCYQSFYSLTYLCLWVQQNFRSSWAVRGLVCGVSVPKHFLIQIYIYITNAT